MRNNARVDIWRKREREKKNRSYRLRAMKITPTTAISVLKFFILEDLSNFIEIEIIEFK